MWKNFCLFKEIASISHNLLLKDYTMYIQSCGIEGQILKQGRSKDVEI